MRIKLTFRTFFLLLGFSLAHEKLAAQDIYKYVLLSGPNSPGTTLFGSSITINGISSSGFKGTVGAYKLIQTTGNTTIKAHIHSGDKVIITNSNVIQGNVAAGNSSGSTGTIVSIGSSVSLTGNMDSKGNIVVGGGTVNGTVNVSPGSYSGPIPSNPIIGHNPQIPVLPTLPAPKTFSSPPTTNITGNTTLTSNSHDTIFSGNMIFSGNKTLKLVNPGVYVFNSFQWSGNSNSLIFDFNGAATGFFYVYVKNNADFGKLNASVANGSSNSASKILVEVQGDGTSGTSIPGYSCIIANGSSGGGSKWQGTVYATRGGINLGSGTGSSSFTGALYSDRAITLQSGATVNYEPFDPCGGLAANAGIDKPLDFVGHAALTGSSNFPGVSFSWQAVPGGGGVIFSQNTNQAQITVASQGLYRLSVQNPSNGCVATDDVNVSGRLKSIIGSELQSIFDYKITDNTYFDIINGYVKIDIIANAGRRNIVIQKLLESLNPGKPGLKDTVPNGLSPLTITGRFFVDSLPKLNLMGLDINFCRPYYKPILFTNGDVIVEDTSRVGLLRSAGDSTINTNLVRIGYSLYGDGIKIGVLSDSYSSVSSGTTATLPLQPSPPVPPDFLPQTFNTNTAAADITNRDIPANIHILPVVPAVSGSDEGRAMLQIVHDVAPGAELYFRSGFHTAGDLARGIKELRDAGCKIIVDDITYSTEPFLKDGIVAKTVDEVKSVAGGGVTYFSSAGNFGNKSYQADFNRYTFGGRVVHNFGTSAAPDAFEKIKLAPGDYVFVFQWLDNIYSLNETAGTQVDLDIFLTRTEDGSGLIGFNRDNLIGDPIEFIPITIPPGDSVEYNLFIVNNTPANIINPRMMYVVLRGNPRFMETYHTGGSTVVGQANANGAIAVGASRFNHQPGHPLLPDALSGITKPQIETFSSRGGTLMMGESTPRQKPEVVGPDGVEVTVKLGSGQDYPNNALNGWPNFFGTSAAAPHIAAAAALVIQGRQRFLSQATTPDQVKSLFQSTATDMETPGFDLISGAGLVNADAAMRTFAEPRPHNIRLVLPANPTSSPDGTFQIIVVGENFSSSTEIWYNDIQLEPDSISPTLDTIWVTVPFPGPNAGHTEIRAYNPPNPNTVIVNGEHLDGGFSNSLFFGEAEVVITALNVAIKYGQQIPTVFDTLITINGKRLQDTALTLAQLGLQNMLVTTNAPENPNVGTYTITPSFNPLNLPGEEFFFKYNYQFVNGNLSIAKMPLNVTPDPITVIEGQPLGNVTFNYVFDHTNVTNAQAIIDDLKTTHQAFLPNNALAVIKDFATSGLTISALNNMNTMASFRAINNSRKFQVDASGQLVPLTDPNTFAVQYFVDVAAQSMIEYIQNPALAKFYAAYPGINKKALLGGTALNNNLAKVNVNNVLEPIVNGTLAQTLTVNNQPKVPILNNELVQIVNGELVQFVNGELEPIVNQELVQIVNNELVQIVNGTIIVLGNNELVQLVNNTLVMMVNNQLEQVVNGIKVQDVNGVLEPLVNQGLVLLVNNELVQIVNGELQHVTLANNEKVLLLNNELVQIVNNELVQIVNGELVQVVNNTLEPIVNQELVQMVNNELVQIVNGVITPIGNNHLVLFPNNELVQMVNNELVQIVNAQIVGGQVNGTLEPFVNEAQLDLVQIVNNELVQIVNGELVQVVNNTLEPIVNQELVQIVNNQLVQYVNNVKTPIGNNQLVLFPNNELVQMVNSQLNQFEDYQIANGQVNGTLEPFVNYVNLNLINSELVQIVNNELVQIVNNVPKPIPNNSLVLFPNNELVQMVNNGLEPIVNNGLEQIVNSGLEPIVNNELVQFVNSNTTGAGNTGNNTAVIIDEADVNAQQHNWLGPMFGINMITGLGIGTNYLIPGKLVNPNFDITYGRGTVTVIPNPCILTRAPAKNFGSTPAPQKPTSLWLNITTKVSGQLSANGDYLFFKSGSVTFNAIASNPLIVDFPLPNGKIIADNSVTVPVTNFDVATNTWITKVPVGFGSTSDIFVTGAIINSSNGFVKQNGNTSSVVKGAFYCTKNFSDQWTYGTATYRQAPAYDYVTYTQIGGVGGIQSINGTYRAGTPIPIIQYLVQGGSGGGGNNYTGSSSSFDNFTACPIAGSSPSSPVTSTMMLEETQASQVAKEFQLMPNPASDNITLSFVPSATGTSIVTVYTIDGRKVFEFNNGSTDAGKQYTKKIDVSKFKNGVYLIQLQSADKVTVRKFLVAR